MFHCQALLKKCQKALFGSALSSVLPRCQCEGWRLPTCIAGAPATCRDSKPLWAGEDGTGAGMGETGWGEGMMGADRLQKGWDPVVRGMCQILPPFLLPLFSSETCTSETASTGPWWPIVGWKADTGVKGLKPRFLAQTSWSPHTLFGYWSQLFLVVVFFFGGGKGG